MDTVEITEVCFSVPFAAPHQTPPVPKIRTNSKSILPGRRFVIYAVLPSCIASRRTALTHSIVPPGSRRRSENQEHVSLHRRCVAGALLWSVNECLVRDFRSSLRAVQTKRCQTLHAQDPVGYPVLRHNKVVRCEARNRSSMFVPHEDLDARGPVRWAIALP